MPVNINTSNLNVQEARHDVAIVAEMRRAQAKWDKEQLAKSLPSKPHLRRMEIARRRLIAHDHFADLVCVHNARRATPIKSIVRARVRASHRHVTVRAGVESGDSNADGGSSDGPSSGGSDDAPPQSLCAQKIALKFNIFARDMRVLLLAKLGTSDCGELPQ